MRTNGFFLGPSLGFKGKRSAKDVGAVPPEVDLTIEAGGFVQYAATDHLRFRIEARQAVNGHDGFISLLSADYVIRDGDKRLLSFGPRMTIIDNRYQKAYFSVRPTAAAASGLPSFDAGGGVQSVGATIGYIQQFSERLGMYSYAKYDRLIGDAAHSPLVRTFGSRDQFSGGMALTYTFGKGVGE